MTHPAPKFQKGSIVRYTPEKRQELINMRKELQKQYPNENLGNQPIHNLLIYENPTWCSRHNCYIYNYEYGWGCTSEGSALETDLVAGDINDGFKLF